MISKIWFDKPGGMLLVGFRHSSSWRWSLLDTHNSMAANRSQNKEKLVEKSRCEIHREAQAADEEKKEMHGFNVRRRSSRTKKAEVE